MNLMNFMKLTAELSMRINVENMNMKPCKEISYPITNFKNYLDIIQK